jgi:hypothetical protein
MILMGSIPTGMGDVRISMGEAPILTGTFRSRW